MELDDRPKRTADAVGRTIDDVFFVLHGSTSELHQIGGVGAHIWDLCDGETSVASMIKTITNEYDVDETTARDDVLGFLALLQDKQLLT